MSLSVFNFVGHFIFLLAVSFVVQTVIEVRFLAFFDSCSLISDDCPMVHLTSDSHYALGVGKGSSTGSILTQIFDTYKEHLIFVKTIQKQNKELYIKPEVHQVSNFPLSLVSSQMIVLFDSYRETISSLNLLRTRKIYTKVENRSQISYPVKNLLL